MENINKEQTMTRIDVIDYEIFGFEMQYVETELDRDEALRAEITDRPLRSEPLPMSEGTKKGLKA